MIRELFKDMAKYLPAQLAPVVISVISIPILTRLFEPGEYGRYVLVMGVETVLAGAAAGWITESIQRFFPKYELENRLALFHNTLLVATVLSIGVFCVIMLLFVALFRGRFDAGNIRLMHLGVILLAVNTAFMICRSILRAKRKANLYTMFSLWTGVAGISIGLLLVLFVSRKVSYLLWGKVLSYSVVLPFLFIISMRKGLSLKDGVSLSITRDLAKYGFPIVFAPLIFWVLSFSDRYVIELFCGSGNVGIYSVSYAVAERSVTLLLSVFSLAATPMSMRILEEKGKSAAGEFLSRLTRYILLSCVPVAVGVSVMGRSIVHIIAAPAYLDGYRLLPIICTALLLNSMSYGFILVFQFTNKTFLFSLLAMAAAVLNIGLNFIFIPKYGYSAAAFTTVCSYAFYFLLVAFVSRSLLIWKFPFACLLKTVCAAAVLGVFFYLMEYKTGLDPWVKLVVSVFAGTFLYGVSFFLFGGFEENEKSMIRRVFK